MLPLSVYRSVFANSPVCEYLLSPDATVLDVNDAFLQTSLRRREDLVGFNLFDVFPENPDDPHDSGVPALRRSLARVIATGQPDTLALQRYPISVPQPDGSARYQERFWSAVNTPIFDDFGRLAYIAHSTMDVTDLHAPQGSAPADDRLARLHAGMFTRAQTIQAVNQALQEERRRLRHLFEHAPGFVYFTRGPDHVVEQWNNAFQALVGGRDVAGKPIREAFPDVEGQGFLDLHDEVFRSGQPYIGHVRRLLLQRSPDEEALERYIDMVYQPIVDEQGQVIGICGQGNDVTGKRRVEEELRIRSERQAYQLELADRLRSLEAADDIVAAASEMLGRNLGASRVLYCEVDDASGTFFIRRDWTHPAHGLDSIAGEAGRLDDLGPGLIAMLRAGEVVRVDDVRLHSMAAAHAPAFERIGVRANLSLPLVKSGRLTAMLSLHDVMPRHWSDDDIEKCQDTAERTWAAVEKARAQAELQEANRRKDEFLAMLAHELRNPLAPISAAAQLMEMGRLDATRLRQTSQVIARQVKHMTGLVDDLLDVSRVTRGLVELHTSAQDIKGIIANALEQVRPLMEAQRHHLAIELPPEPAHVMGDGKRLVQILTNLLNNAAKYTPPGGQISLTAQVQADQVVVHVCDNGIGIPPELQQRIFELFAQAERTPDRSQGGLGLGLALVKSLAELHGGEVECRSEGPGRGSCFTVRLPLLASHRAPQERRHGSRAIGPAPNRLKVLVVDDNADAAEMLAMLLESSGHDVVVEHGGKAALETARIAGPDVCLLDIGLPDMDGKVLAQRLRAQRETHKAILIAITGYGQEQDRQSALAAGFHHHLVKPVDPQRLVALLDEVGRAAAQESPDREGAVPSSSAAALRVGQQPAPGAGVAARTGVGGGGTGHLRQN
jgi:signal transduction histidine kinase/DNA-binding NarL/FixJ family response regulator